MDSSLYRQEILEHYRNPQNFGTLKQSSFEAFKVNELCGDEIKIQILTDKPIPPLYKGRLGGVKIKDIRFTGSGCAISIASASLFTEYIKGKSLEDVKKMKPENVIKLLGISVSPARRKCALLPYDAIQSKLNE